MGSQSNMILKIFDARALNEAVPEGFNAVRVSIDGSVTSSLDWEEARNAASRYAGQGLNIFWDINLGIFSSFQNPFKSQAHDLSLTLALEHFCNTLWNEFSKITVGVCLYRSLADFTIDYSWEVDRENSLRNWLEENFKTMESLERSIHLHDAILFEEIDHTRLQLYCRDQVLDCLDLLAGHLPAEIPSFALLDATGFDDPVQLASLLYNERHSHVHFGVKGSLLPFQEMGWDDRAGPMGYIGRQVLENQAHSLPNVAICLPQNLGMTERLRPAFEKLLQAKVSFRIIPESQLIQKWDGLDYLVVFSDNLGSQGLRKLKGFCAAGGTVVNMGKPLGLPYEISFDAWQNNKSID